MQQQISIQSEHVFMSSSVGDVNIQSNNNINTYAGGSIIIQTGNPQNTQNNLTINSRNIVLGVQPNSTIKLESVVKSDQLILILQQMLSIMTDIINNPDEVKCITEEIVELEKQLNKIKYSTTKTY